MKASERQLLMVFLTLAVVLGSVLLGQRLRAWQHSLERKERDVELKQMESAALLAQGPEWLAKGQWLSEVQPAVVSELDANQEIQFGPVMRALVEVGYQGYVGHEFIPTRDALEGLREAVTVCDV